MLCCANRVCMGWGWRSLEELQSRTKDSIERVSRACHPTLMRSVVVVVVNVCKCKYRKGFCVLARSQRRVVLLPPMFDFIRQVGTKSATYLSK